MSPPKVQVVVLQYNNSQNTVKCLESLQHLDYPNFRVLVIDNGSEKKEADIIEKFVSRLPITNHQLLPIREANRGSSIPQSGIGTVTSYQLLVINLGYSGGNNIGIKYALENDADFVLLLNNDATVEKNLITKLVLAAESVEVRLQQDSEKVGIVGPAINEGNQTVCDGKVKWLKAELTHRSCHDSQFTIRDSYIPGVAMLIGREVIEKIGLLDERYFLYFEDADYCLRAVQAGYRLKIVPEAVVHHQVSSSTSKLGSALLLRYHFRNAHLFNRKHGPWWVQILLPIWSFWVIIKQTVKIVFIPARRKVSAAIIEGVVDFYRGRFGPIKKIEI